jgi:hypothetical protein
LNYRQLLRHPKYKDAWSKSAADEFGRFAQGVGNRIKGTNTIHFIQEQDIPKACKKYVTYGSFICTVCPKKADPNRTHFVVGGDKCNYPYAVVTPTAEMLVAKMLFNHLISTPRACFMNMDISNFYLVTPLLGTGAADLVNHSCDPSALLSGALTLVARRDLATGEELTFDYGTSDSNPYLGFVCRCGAAGCRGRVTGDDWRDPELQTRYGEAFAPHILRRIRAEAHDPAHGSTWNSITAG